MEEKKRKRKKKRDGEDEVREEPSGEEEDILGLTEGEEDAWQDEDDLGEGE